jgi:hypothetical protein
MVEATVLNVQNAADIALKINGNPSSAFSYNTSTKKMQIAATLNPGSNLFEITATNAAGSDYKNTTIIYKEPVLNYPPVVTYTVPSTNPFSTTSSSTTVHAKVIHVQTQNQVTVKLNNNNLQNFTFNPVNGDVSFIANLLPGANMVQVTGTNPYGTDSKILTIIYNKVEVNLPPYVTITYPAVNPYNTTLQTENVVATVLNVTNASAITFKANGVVNNNFTYNTSTKVFAAQVTLHTGTNIFEIKAVNPYGQDTKTQTIIYSDPCNDPWTTPVSPVSNVFTSATQQLAFSAQVSHITQSSQITLKNNGNTIPFQFDANTGMVSATISLVNGSNLVVLKSVNNCGQDQEDYTITYIKPVQPPVVNFIQPATNPHAVTAASFNVSASVLHVANAGAITFKLNGTSSTAFNYNTATQVLTSSVNLNQGNNTVEITAVNNDGSDSKSTVIVYNPVPPPCKNPVVAITYPASANYTTQSQVLQVTATVLNATQQQISLKLNGATQQFTLNGNNLVATLTLQNGTNNIVLSATNTCGTHSATVNTTYNRPIVPPVVTITQPGVNPFIATNANGQILAKIYHVSSQQNVAFKINGSPVTAFTFNPATNDFSANYTLTLPSTVFEITGTNQDGSDSKSVTINYIQANPLCKKPVITLIQPNTVTNTTSVSAYTLTAQVAHVQAASDITIKQNGINKTFNWNAANGTLSLNGILDNGLNNFEIKATNNCGSVSENITITYNKPLVPPVVTITTPQPSPHSTTATSQQVLAAIQHVPQVSGVTCKVNGSNFTGFTYNPSSGAFAATVNLVAGSNTVEITGVNSDGMDSESVIIISNPIVVPPCVAPTVSITSPSGNNLAPQQTLTAQVGGTMVQNNISVQLNGSSVSFTFVNGVVSAPLTLSAGPNNITIVATNACGNETKSVTVTACSNPTVIINAPATGTTFNTASTPFSAVVTGVAQNEISLKNNGQPVSFTYNANTQIVSATVNLTAGHNVIETYAQNACNKETKVTEVDYVVAAPNPPVVTITSPATNGTTVSSDAFTILGTVLNVNSQNEITVSLNGQHVPNFTYNATSQVVTAPVTLVAGNNTIQISATNAGGSDSKQKTINYVPPVVIQPPVVTITTPAANGTTVAATAYTALATVQNVDSQNDITVKHNGQNVNFTYNTTTHVVTTNLTLTPGSNTIIVTGTNQAGNASDQKSITCTPPVVVNPPDVTITVPATNGTTVSVSALTVTATVTNVPTQSGVTVKLNGQNVNFTFNPANGLVTSNVTLADGNNTIVVTGTNSAGTDSDQKTITYAAPVNNDCMPQVSATFATDHKSATANSTKDLSNVVLKFHDGVHQKFENLTGNTGTFAGTGANAGKCIVGVWIKSGCNQSNDGPGYGEWVANTGYNNNCSAPVINPPVVTITVPASSGTTVSAAAYTTKATVLNVNSQNDITVKVNGQNVNFTYNATTKLVTANITLNNGSNSIEVTGTNAAGTDTKQTSINYEIPCIAPTVNITLPANNATISGASFNLSANVSNVTQNQITVKLNGTNVPFNLANNSVSASLTAVSGSNTVVVTVTNECGNQTASAVVTYTPVVTTCGPRFNPGNSAWEFCLITPSGTYTRDNLASNNNFTYSGSASSAYFKPIAGGGDAVVNGSTYPVQNGNYYLFTGNLTVDVSTSHPGSMGHWSICIQSNTAPVSGNGNNRPASPCETNNNNNNGGGNNNNTGGGNNNNTGGGGCIPQVGATFVNDHKTVNVTSTKDLSNVVLKYDDGVHQKFENLSGKTGTFAGTGANTGRCIVGVWIKSGCNQSNDGPGYGEWVANTAFSVCSTPKNTGGNNKNEGGNNGGNLNTGGNNNNNNNGNNMITICHTPPGGGQSQTIQIPQSAWPMHQAHGDVMGPCAKTENGGNTNPNNNQNKNQGGGNNNNTGGGNVNPNNNQNKNQGGGNNNNTGGGNVNPNNNQNKNQGGGNNNNTGGGNVNPNNNNTGGGNKVDPNRNKQPNNNNQPNNSGNKKEEPKKEEPKKEQPKTEEKKEEPKSGTEEKKEEPKTQPDRKVPAGRRPTTGGGGGG